MHEHQLPTPLHSILVKSILIFVVVTQPPASPLHSILVKSIHLPTANSESLMNSLHSILVKSIRSLPLSDRDLNLLYIPFWLNLYAEDNKNFIEKFLFTFHSG